MPQPSLEMSPISDRDDVERLAGLDVAGVDFKAVLRNPPKMLDIQNRAGQGCFLCLESPKQGQFATLVLCLRPPVVRPVVGYSGGFGDNPQPIYENGPWHNACESDNDIYRRLVATCYHYLGGWKRWLPYYGVTNVLEVNVRLNAL